MTDSTEEPQALSARLEALERSVAGLRDEVARLREQVAAVRAQEDVLDLAEVATPGPAPAPAKAPQTWLGRILDPRPAGDPTRPPPAGVHAARAPLFTTDEVESVVGRYGMLALATLTGLAAVGTFLGWAITQGILGPPARVALGLAVAGALGAAGLRLRRRERSFGATLLGLGLATTHLCAWAAGALLGLVPTWAGLALAAAVSIALAGFAQSENDEPLWCVGFGGAAVAPFVASPDDASAALVAGYGLIVLISGAYALAGRSWPIASRVFAAVTALFVGALMAMPEREGGPLMAVGLPLFVAVGGVLPFVRGGAPVSRPSVRVGGSHRGHLRSLGVFAAAASIRAAIATRLPVSPEALAGAIAAAGLVWLLVVDRTGDTPASDMLGGLLPNTATIAEWVDGAWVPLAFAAALVVAADAGRWANGALAAGSGLALLGIAARRRSGALRDAAAFATAVCILVAVAIVGDDRRHEMTAGVAAAGVLFFVANRAWPSYSWVWAGGVALVMASVGTVLLLAERPPYAYTPFVTRASATAFGVAICWALAARIAPNVPIAATRTLGAAAIGAWTWAFVWVHQEIQRAFSPTVSTLLLVTYYASTSVAAVGVGRGRSIAGLRHVGLALGLLAAATAIRGARRLEAVWAEIVAYLVASVFLLGIAYWYRRREGE